MSKVSHAVIFALGIGVGVVSAWKHWQMWADNQVESVKERFTVPRGEAEDRPTPVRKSDQTEVKVYENKLVEAGYTDYSKPAAHETELPTNEPVIANGPEVISPEEFNEGEYETVSFNYYADGVLADDNDQPIPAQEIVGMIGDALDRFGEYEDDVVYVRDNYRHIDYEIVKDMRNYSDILGGR